MWLPWKIESFGRISRIAPSVAAELLDVNMFITCTGELYS